MYFGRAAGLGVLFEFMFQTLFSPVPPPKLFFVSTNPPFNSPYIPLFL